MTARVEHVGSLLRPQYLRDARAAQARGGIGPAEFKVTEDRAVREIVAMQEEVGLPVVNDGELRRESFQAGAVLGLSTVESVLVGGLGVLAGVAAGYGLLIWLTATTVGQVMPEIGVTATLSSWTVITALVLGIGAVALAPAFTTRKLRRMDIPSTLRVIE